MKLRLRAEAISASNLAFTVPEEDVLALGAGKRPPVVVTVGSGTFRTRIAPMGGCYLIGITKANRALAGLEEGVTYDLEVQLDTQERTVEVPSELTAAFATDPALRPAWDAWSYTRRREAAEGITGAKRPDTRARRVAVVLDALRA